MNSNLSEAEQRGGNCSAYEKTVIKNSYCGQKLMML